MVLELFRRHRIAFGERCKFKAPIPKKTFTARRMRIVPVGLPHLRIVTVEKTLRTLYSFATIALDSDVKA